VKFSLTQRLKSDSININQDHISIGANIIEATASSSRRDFIRFYEIALKSANETVYWISLLKDSGLVKLTKCEEIIDECSQISKMLGASLLTLKNKR